MARTFTPDQLRYVHDEMRRQRRRGPLEAIKDVLVSLGRAPSGRDYGTVKVEVGSHDGDLSRKESEGLTRPFVYDINIRFEPNEAADADEIGFIQTARVVKVEAGRESPVQP